MAIRRVTQRDRRGTRVRDIGVRRWHTRRVVYLNGTLMVSLPIRLVRWDRHRLMDPHRWQPGDEVEVGLTMGGMFVVRMAAPQMEIGLVPDGELHGVGELGEAPARRVGSTKKKAGKASRAKRKAYIE